MSLSRWQRSTKEAEARSGKEKETAFQELYVRYSQFVQFPSAFKIFTEPGQHAAEAKRKQFDLPLIDINKIHDVLLVLCDLYIIIYPFS